MLLNRLIGTAVVGLISTSMGLAFFPPVTAPVAPVTNIQDPSPIQPVQRPTVVPPVDPVVKPQPKPRPKPTVTCSCNVNTQQTPEPATLISAGLGAVVLGAYSAMKKRKKSAEKV
jgi:hypothetical protein